VKHENSAVESLVQPPSGLGTHAKLLRSGFVAELKRSAQPWSKKPTCKAKRTAHALTVVLVRTFCKFWELAISAQNFPEVPVTSRNFP
jgi:hypothetical protein